MSFQKIKLTAFTIGLLGFCLVAIGHLNAKEPLTQKQAFTYEDLLRLNRLSGLTVSPDETQAVFAIRATDMAANRGISALYVKKLNEPNQGHEKLSVNDKGAHSPQWGGDGRLYFLSERSGSTQIWSVSSDFVDLRQVTDLPLDVGAYRIAPLGGFSVVSLAISEKCQMDEINCTLRTQKAASEQKGTGQVYDRLFVRHWDSWHDGTRSRLFMVPALAPKTALALTPGFDGDIPSKPFGDEGDFVIAPDGKSVVASVRAAGMTEPWSTNFDLWSFSIDGKSQTNLTKANLAWDAHPRFSPDGKYMAYKAMKRPGFEADRFAIFVKELKSGKVKPLASDWDRSIEQMIWSKDSQSLLVTADDHGSHKLFRIGLKDGLVMALSRDGHMDSFAEIKNSFVYVKSGLSGPAVLYQRGLDKSLVVDATSRILVDPNTELLRQRALGAYESFVFKGYNGADVRGMIVKPANFDPKKRYPLAFLIHGGPQSSFLDIWSYRWNAQTYAGRGYVAVMIDFHGSTGYGQDFTDAITGHWGDRPLEDLKAGLSYVLKTYSFVDGDRACALGASYGGYMVNWIASQWKTPEGTNGWKCLVSHAGIFDQRSMGYGTEELWFTEWENEGSAFTNPVNYDRFNPALHSKDWSVPMLVIHGQKDYRVLFEQGISAFTANQAMGVKSRFVQFPDEGHWILKPQNSNQWHEEVFQWLDHNTKDQAED
jgi:acylaminoacyl-peptidase